MFFENDLPEKVSNDDHAFDLLRELERNTPEEIRKQRSTFRITIKSKVVLQPGNASEILKFKVQGVTGDLSEGGCKALFPTPVRVGDVYRLRFDRHTLDLPLTFARFVRCFLVKDFSYEAGFRFFTPVTLPSTTKAAPAESLAPQYVS